jgi:tRNA modification GTPase
LSTHVPEILELTPRGRGGVSVVAVRGSGALALARTLVPGGRVALGRPVLARLEAGGEALDQALVYAESEHEVELHLHGAPAVVARVIEVLALRSSGTERESAAASLEELAESLLAVAPSEAAARVLLDQAQGALRGEIVRIADAVDYAARRSALRALIDGAPVARRLLRPPRVVIAGPANAGKSTLFNLLAGYERAIVHPEPGTTRDALHERVLLGAYAVDLLDTAGERDLPELQRSAALEARGQDLARALAGQADLVLWLCPPWDDRSSVPRAGVLRVIASRADERAQPAEPAISCRQAPDAARRTVEAVFHEALGLPRDPWRAGAPALFSDALVEYARAVLDGPPSSEAWRSALAALLSR